MRNNLQPDVFPIPQDKVALFDIDGTLIDKDYNVTDEDLYPAVQEAQDAGWVVGLSSDTPYEAMTLWRERFGMNGPIIAEKGAMIEQDGVLEYNTDDARCFGEACENIEDRFRALGAVIWRGNPVEAIKSGIKIGSQGDTVVMVNSLRTCSMGFFVRSVGGEGELRIDSELTETFATEARQYYPALEIAEDLNHDFGLLIAARENMSKRVGSLKLMAAMGITRFAMVGNSFADYVGSDIAIHYAVGDATPELKEQADYVATGPITQGAVEILQGFAANTTSV